MQILIKYIIIFILFLFLSNSLFAQNLQGIVYDAHTNEKLSLCNISFLKSNKGTNTNEQGWYKIDISNHLNDSIKISYIGYASKTIALKEFVNKEKLYTLDIQLIEKTNQLKEIKIESSNAKYTKQHTLGEVKKANVGLFSVIGYETACLIENPYDKNGRLKRITLDLKKNHEADFIAKFNIKIYRFDKENNKPGEELLTKNLIIAPENRSYKLRIDVLEMKIPFPKDGICIGIELIDPNNESKSGDRIGPGFRFTFKESKPLTWFNFRGKGWFNNYLDQKQNKGNLMVGIDVLLPE